MVYCFCVFCVMYWDYDCGEDINIQFLDSCILLVCGGILEGILVVIWSIGMYVLFLYIDQRFINIIILLGDGNFWIVGLISYVIQGLGSYSF